MEPQQEEAMEQQDPGVEGFAGLAQSEQAKMQAAESLKDSQPESSVKVVVIPTDEEYMIASDTLEIVSAL